MTAGTGAGGGGTPRRPLAGVALVVAVVVILAWLVLLGWLLIEVGTTEVTWSRLLVVLGSVQAVAFAAAGALFGTTVQSQRVNEQRSRADDAESRMEGLRAQVTNGHKLAAAVKATLGGGDTDPTREQLTTAARPPAQPLVELAERLFPD